MSDELYLQVLTDRSSGVIKRYHTWPTIGNQTVAEHSWGVAMLLWRCCVPPYELIAAALHHDCGEIFTGDLPHHVKEEYPTLNKLLEGIERNKFSQLEWVHESQLDPKFVPWLRAADILELMMYALDQRLLGNKSMDKIMENGYRILSDIQGLEGTQFMMIGNRVWETYQAI